jgi:hypothetical protein
MALALCVEVKSTASFFARHGTEIDDMCGLPVHRWSISI